MADAEKEAAADVEPEPGSAPNQNQESDRGTSASKDEVAAAQMDDLSTVQVGSSADDAAPAETNNNKHIELDWETELELVVSSPSVNYSDIRRIANGKTFPKHVRARVWQVLLGIAAKGDPMADFDELYNLPEQNAIRSTCQRLAASLGNPESERMTVTSDLESVLTHFCKTRQVQFTSDNGWAAVLEILLTLGLPRPQLYNTFHAVITKYIATGCVRDGKPFDLFRLLLLYHDPQLCSLLDTKKISPDRYATDWFNSLMARSTSLDVVLRMWDVYLQQADPFLVFFMALVILLNAKELIISLKDEDASKIIEQIRAIPGQLEPDDIEDFCQLATYYSTRTPQSFRRDYHGPLFGSNLAAEDFANVSVHSLLCLPVSVPELLQAIKSLHRDTDEQVHYFVVDARPMAQYMNGHLPGAFNLDASLLVSSPSDYTTSVESLLAYKHRTQPTAHWCFMGSGRDDEDQYVHMVVAAWLQKAQQYVSVTRGGYQALHETLRESLSTRLKSHNVAGCLACRQLADNQSPNKLSPRSPGHSSNGVQHRQQQQPFSGEEALGSIIDRLSGAFKTRSTDIRERLFDWATNPVGEGEDLRHVNAGERHGKRYRGVASAFSIADDDEQAEESEEAAAVAECSRGGPSQPKPAQHKPVVKLDAWLREMHVDDVYEIEYLCDKDKTLYPGRVALTSGHMYVLLLTGGAETECLVHAKRPLQAIHKITSRKRLPELLTLKSGYELSDGEYRVQHVDRVLSDKAGDIAKALKTAIVTLHEMDRQIQG